MNDERKATIEVDMTDDEWIELLCLCEEINLTPGDLAVAFCQEVIRSRHCCVLSPPPFAPM